LFWLDNMGSVGNQSATDWSGDDFVITGEGAGFRGHPKFRDKLNRTWVILGEDDCTKR
jgi:hypothetical protein